MNRTIYSTSLNTTNPSRKTWLLPALFCAALAWLVRLVAWLLFQSSILYNPVATSGHDRSVYLQAIQQAVQGTFLPEGSLSFLPLYPWLIGLLSSIFSPVLSVAAFTGMTCDAATTLLIVWLAHRLHARDGWAALAGIVYALYPLAVMYSLLTMPNTLNVLGVTAFACAAHVVWEKPSPPRWQVFLLGLLAGVVALGFAGILLIAGATACCFTIRFRTVLLPAIFVCGMALPITPVALHNSKAEGSFVLLTTHGGFNLYMGNHPEATGYPLRIKDFRMTAATMLEDAHKHAEQQSGRSLTRAQSSAWWNREAQRFWREQPVQASWITVKKVLRFWSFREMDDLRMLEQVRITDQILTGWKGTPFAVFGIFGLIGLLYARNAPIPKLVLLSGMIGLVLFFITARYRLTLTPLMAVLGVSGLTTLWEQRALRSWRHMLVIGVILLVVLFPWYVRDQRPIDYYNVSVQLSQAEKFEQALAVVEQGLEIDPVSPDLLFGRGNLLFKLNRFSEAATSYQQSLERNPNNPTAVFNLILSMAKNGAICEAQHAFQEIQRQGLPITQQTQALYQDIRRACEETDATVQ